MSSSRNAILASIAVACADRTIPMSGSLGSTCLMPLRCHRDVNSNEAHAITNAKMIGNKHAHLNRPRSNGSDQNIA
jgi:hypothetical protein